MGRNTKWIEGQSDDAVDDVARRAIGARLERMWHYLQFSVRAPKSETENVHQLRVFARRAAAALEIFADWLPSRHGQWTQKQVKRVRKAAGEARDFDVLWMRWRERSEQMPAAQSRLLLKHIKRRRREAQAPIEAINRKLVAKRFLRRTSELLDRVRWHGRRPSVNQPFGCMARVALDRLVVPYLAAARAEMSGAEALHAFRIQGKQMRYAMEIFAGAFDAEFREELYPVVAMLQDRLGAINDHVTAQAYLVNWRDATDSRALRQALEMGMQHEQHCFNLSQQEFLTWWTLGRQEDLRRRFIQYVPLAGAGDQPSCFEDCGH